MYLRVPDCLRSPYSWHRHIVSRSPFFYFHPQIVVKTASIINDPINSLHCFLLGCQSDGEPPLGGSSSAAARFSPARPWISTFLRSFRVRAKVVGPGFTDCWCSQFMVVMSFLLAERNTEAHTNTHTPSGVAGGSVPSRVPPLVIMLEGRKVNGSIPPLRFLLTEWRCAWRTGPQCRAGSRNRRRWS